MLPSKSATPPASEFRAARALAHAAHRKASKDNIKARRTAKRKIRAYERVREARHRSHLASAVRRFTLLHLTENNKFNSVLQTSTWRLKGVTHSSEIVCRSECECHANLRKGRDVFGVELTPFCASSPGRSPKEYLFLVQRDVAACKAMAVRLAADLFGATLPFAYKHEEERHKDVPHGPPSQHAVVGDLLTTSQV
jgi:hypothetical protein